MIFYSLVFISTCHSQHNSINQQPRAANRFYLSTGTIKQLHLKNLFSTYNMSFISRYIQINNMQSCLLNWTTVCRNTTTSDPGIVNTFWRSDVKWRNIFRSTVGHVMARCLTAPSHCLNTWLTHIIETKIATISQATFSSAFSWTKIHEFRLRFHWSLFLSFDLAIFRHWFG